MLITVQFPFMGGGGLGGWGEGVKSSLFRFKKGARNSYIGRRYCLSWRVYSEVTGLTNLCYIAEFRVLGRRGVRNLSFIVLCYI
jgi:hypothetical protein